MMLPRRPFVFLYSNLYQNFLLIYKSVSLLTNSVCNHKSKWTQNNLLRQIIVGNGVPINGNVASLQYAYYWFIYIVLKVISSVVHLKLHYLIKHLGLGAISFQLIRWALMFLSLSLAQCDFGRGYFWFCKIFWDNRILSSFGLHLQHVSWQTGPFCFLILLALLFFYRTIFCQPNLVTLKLFKKCLPWNLWHLSLAMLRNCKRL